MWAKLLGVKSRFIFQYDGYVTRAETREIVALCYKCDDGFHVASFPDSNVITIAPKREMAFKQWIAKTNMIHGYGVE